MKIDRVEDNDSLLGNRFHRVGSGEQQLVIITLARSYIY